tara:strand:- start:5860 stop:7737 length:1878 start_codon:yes stop_codon:yes gene_type:complete
MSLVVCSNKDSDGTERQGQSIYKAWSFRNSLSSTYTVPAQSQVALQSCKVNIDGRVVFGSNNHRFYHYMGQKVGTEIPIPAGQAATIKDTTSHPCITTLTNDTDGGSIVELTVDDFAQRLQEQVRSTTYHPNAKEQFTCDVIRNASSVDFLGYSLTAKQNVSVPTFVPATGAFEQFYRDDDEYAADAPSPFSYIGGVFKREADDRMTTACGICPSRPLSLTEGEFQVNISTASANANASGVEWHVGLSRFINVIDSEGYYYPNYNDYGKDAGIATQSECHMDFAVCRNIDGELVVYQDAYDPVHECTRRYEVQYWLNPETDATFSKTPKRFAMDGTSFDYVKFKVDGEQVSIVINIVGTGEATIVDYSAAANKEYMFKPVNQSCWCLHPVLMVGRTDASEECTLELVDFSGMNISGYDPKTLNKGGWFETLELVKGKGTAWALSVEERTWNQPSNGTAYAQIATGVAPNNGVDYSFVYILEESDIYAPTFGANARQLLGFNSALLQTPNTSVPANGGRFSSVFTPTRVSSLAMFVKLNNFGQKVVNARTGFESKILSHLTDLETLSGRQTYEPNNLIWLDLDNPADMNINEFDISFVYCNEQYATILTGQSIVCLYFRKKPKELM